VVGGCETGSGATVEPALTDPGTGESLAFTGDPIRVFAAPRDLDPAVSYAIDRRANNMGQLEVVQTAEGARLYRLTTADDRPAWFRAAAADGSALDAGDPEPRELLLTARVGRFGNASRELGLLRSVHQRLRALAESVE